MEKTLLRVHPTMLDRPFALAACVGLCFVGVGIPILLVWWVRNLCTTLTVTDQRTTLRRGLIAKHESEVWHEDVRNVVVSQGVIQRLLGTGGVGISSAGQSGFEIEARGIHRPADVQKAINAHRRRQAPTPGRNRVAAHV